MTRFTKTASGKYMVQGKSYEMLMGSRAQVWHGTAYKTSGGLTKTHLMQNKSGRIVSKEKHNTAKKERRLVKAGYGTKKGKFGFVLLGKSRKHNGRRTRSRKHKGGNGVGYPLSPSSYDGEGVGTSGVNLQFVAGNAA
jgi:hypothetical protein